MRSKMKRPTLGGVGLRNDTVEAVRQARVLELAADEAAARAARARPQAIPMAPERRSENYVALLGRRITPAQRRRTEKKQHRFLAREGAAWHSHGSDVLTAFDEHKLLEPREDDGPELPPWDPEQCGCHINPPCHYCESGEYRL